MTPAQLLQAISQAGGRVMVDNGDLVLRADRPLPDVLVTALSVHKPDLIVLLQAELPSELKQAKEVFGGTLESVVENLRQHFEERVAIMEYDGGLPRAEAELEAARITSTYARNMHYQWRALRAAIDYPDILAKLPDTDGVVDTLPLGVARYRVIPESSVIKDRVVSQGAYTSTGLLAGSSTPGRGATR